MESANPNSKWFSRMVWLGIFANLAFAIPALFFPEVFSSWLGLGPVVPTIWMRNAGLLLVLLCCFYVLVARAPLDALPFSYMTVAARFVAAFFWFVLIIRGHPKVLLEFLFTDFSIGLIQGFFLQRAVGASPHPPRRPWRRSLFSRTYSAIFRLLNRFVSWDHLFRYLGAANLGAIREDLRDYNLYDTPAPPAKSPEWEPKYRSSRSPDGSFNDLAEPRMGQAEARFGRNMPLETVWPKPNPELSQPSPREISRHLLARDTFKPAASLNLLAAAWIQFQNHGWFNHEKNRGTSSSDFYAIPLKAGDDWVDPDNIPGVLRIRRSVPDPTRPADAPYPPTYRNTESHWWDASQLYGSSLAIQDTLRSKVDGKLNLDPQTGLLPLDPALSGVDLTGFNDNWWLGLSLMHTLFTMEHNAICDHLAKTYPDRLTKKDPALDDDWLFQKTRLITSALLAKIHTVEWTPGILAHPTLKISMNSNWWGVLGEWVKEHYGRFGDSEAVSGIIGSSTEHHAAPFAMTEEFISVYRLHPLIPDDIKFWSLSNRSQEQGCPFTDIQGTATRSAMQKFGPMVDILYSFGRQNPGQITLRNYPNSLRQFKRMNGDVLDLAALDILRDRERGVPRYNQFRQLVRKRPVQTFEEMTGRSSNDSLVVKLKEIYQNEIDRVDLMVGLFAEPVPRDFGFSDTAFRIFILMASRRLKSDRFFTVDFRPEVYTPAGIDWVNATSMLTVLQRHFPALAPALAGVGNAFAPWKPI